MTPEWSALCGALPDHQGEVMSAHGGQPSPSVQAKTHGAGIAGQDNGMDEAAKYGTAPAPH